ncbi:hypothetical protein Bca4012_070015 [Brassica carinata]
MITGRGARARRRRDSSSRPCSSAVLLVRFPSALLVDSGPTPTEPPRPVSVLTPPVSPLRPSPCSSREALRYSVAGSDEQTDSVILLLDPCSVVVLSFLSRVNLFSVRSLKSNPGSMVTEDFVRSLKSSLRSMVKEGFPFHTSPAKNILIERYVSNPALRALISLQDLFGTAKSLVEERIVAILVSLQYSTNQSFEDRLLLVNVLVVTGLYKVQLSLRQDKSVFTAKPCVRYLLLLHTFTSMPQLLRFINFYVSWPTTTLSHTGRGEMALTSIPCSLVSTPYMESEKIFVPIASAPFSLNNMLFQTYEIHLVFLESIIGRSPDAPFLRLQCMVIDCLRKAMPVIISTEPETVTMSLLKEYSRTRVYGSTLLDQATLMEYYYLLSDQACKRASTSHNCLKYASWSRGLLPYAPLILNLLSSKSWLFSVAVCNCSQTLRGYFNVDHSDYNLFSPRTVSWIQVKYLYGSFYSLNTSIVFFIVVSFCFRLPVEFSSGCNRLSSFNI